MSREAACDGKQEETVIITATWMPLLWSLSGSILGHTATSDSYAKVS